MPREVATAHPAPQQQPDFLTRTSACVQHAEGTSLRAAGCWGGQLPVNPEPGLAEAWQPCLYSPSAQHIILKLIIFSLGIILDFTLNVFWGKIFH